MFRVSINLSRLRNKNIKMPLSWLILVSWLLLVGLVMWVKFNEPYRNFIETRMPKFSDNKIIDDVDGLTVLHFIDKKCPCTRFSEKHIETLEQELKAANHVRIQATELPDFDPAIFNDWVISSPSVAVINTSGELAYYGPYTDALLCNQGRDIVKQVIENLEETNDYYWFNVLGYGCFCEWPEWKTQKI